jgi:hypothetical protein
MRLPVIIVSGASVASVLALGWLSFHSSKAPEVLTAKAARSIASVAVSAEPERRSYLFNREIHARTGTQDLFRLSLFGKLWVHTDQNGTEFTMKIDSPEQLRSSPLVRLVVSKSNELTQVQIVREHQGRHDKDFRETLARIGVDLLQQFLFFEQKDLQGSYEARFTQVDSLHFEKTKLAYSSEPYSKARLENSHHTLSLSPTGGPEEVRGTELLKMGDDAMTLVSNSSYKILRESDLTPWPWLGEGASWQEISLASVFGTPVASRPSVGLQEAELAEIPSVSALIQTLRTGKLKTAQQRLGVYRRLVKRLNHNGSDVSRVAGALPGFKSREAEFGVLVGALASSNQPDAHQVLQSVFNDGSYSRNAQELVLNSWVVTGAELPKATTEFLKKLAADTERTENSGALLALGSQVSRSSDPQQKADLENFLVERLQQARAESEKVAALDAMGNAGSAGFLPYIRGFLVDPSEHVRARAYMALRLIPGDDVARMLESGRSDPSPEVKRSADLALNLRSG